MPHSRVSEPFTMAPTANGRALPPRPTLLVGAVGDVGACWRAWQQLEPTALDLLRRAGALPPRAPGSGLGEPPGPSPTPDEWDSAVRAFRSLRESLVAAYVDDEQLAVQVYERSVDVCAAAGSWSECLKALQGLALDLYPKHAAAAAGSKCSSSSSSSSSSNSGCIINNNGSSGKGGAQRSPGARGSLDQQQEQQQQQQDPVQHVTGAADGPSLPPPDSDGNPCRFPRRPEMCAAVLLFFALVPRGGGGGGGGGGPGGSSSSWSTEAVMLLRSPHMAPLLSTPHVQFALQVLAALSRGDWRSVLRLRAAAPSALLRTLMDARLQQVRTTALRCLALAYRSLPAAAAASALCLDLDPDPQHGSNGSGSSSSGSSSGGASGTHGARPGEGVVRHGLAAAGPPPPGAGAWRALLAALKEAEAGGVRGAGVALSGLSGWGDAEGAAGAGAGAGAGGHGGGSGPAAAAGVDGQLQQQQACWQRDLVFRE